MNRRAVLASVSGALLVTALVPATTSAAPAPTPPGPGSAQGPADVPRGDADGDHVSDEFAPRLRAAAAGEKLAVIVRGLGADRAAATAGPFRVTQQLPLVDGFSAVMTAAQARALARHPGVFRVDQDGPVRALDDATGSDFGATAAWADRPGLDGSGVGICVIDTGVDPAHEQIAPRTVTFHDFVGSRATAYDDHGHGTHVTSIAAGDGVGSSSAATYRGVAPAADLYAAKVLDSTGYGSDSQVIAGIQWCHDQAGVRVLSMSLGDTIVSDGSDPVSAAVNAAESGGDVVVVAAGNSGDGPGTIAAPGVATGALTVGAASDWSAPVGTARHDDGIWLAAFSSRGPVAGTELTKPDVTAPGVSVTAANAGTTSGYVTMSGTSMATPYVAGAVALGLEAAASATPAQVRSAVMTSAADRGPAGLDNEWGAGLIDVRAFVDTLTGAASPRRTAFPTWTRTTGSVPTNGFVNVPITVGADGLGVPLAVTLTVTSGQLSCDVYCQLGLTAGEWTPDLDVELRDPSGAIVADSQCALSGVSCATGRQETIGIRPTVAGTYTLRVYAWTGGSGAGGTYAVDVSRGPLGGGTVEPPPSGNQPPVAIAGPDRSVKVDKRTKTASFTLTGSGSDPEGGALTFRWTRQDGSEVSTSAAMTDTRPAGTYTYTLTVTDPGGLSGSDSATVTVRR